MTSEKHQLWKAILHLYEILNAQIDDETAYQAFFENNPIVFRVLGYDTHQSFEKKSEYKLPYDSELDWQPEPDFLCATQTDCILTVFELKTPFQAEATTSQKSGRRKKFKSTVESHIAQAQEYVQSIAGRQDARQYLKELFQLEKIASYDIVLVYGLISTQSPSDTQALLSQRSTRTRILKYDELFEKIINAYALTRPDLSSKKGWTFVACLALSPNQAYKRSFIFDMGNKDGTRISMILENDQITFMRIDGTSDEALCSAPAIFSTPTYYKFEISAEEDRSFVSFSIDDEEVDFRERKKPIEVDLDHARFVMGADNSGTNGACFKSFDYYHVNRTISIYEKIESYIYWKQKTKGFCVKFDEKHYMASDSNGNLVQEDPELKPITSDQPVYSG